MMMGGPKCGAIGSIISGGREIATLACELDFGHGDFGINHHATIEWRDEAIVELPDADLLDPGEVMDVDVPFGRIDRDDDFGL